MDLNAMRALMNQLDDDPIVQLGLKLSLHLAQNEMTAAADCATRLHAMVRDLPVHSPDRITSLRVIASLHRRRGDYRSALELLGEAYAGVTAAPDLPVQLVESVVRTYADVLQKAGEHDRATELAREAKKLDTGNDLTRAFTNQLLARLSSEVGDFAGADRENEEARRIIARTKDSPMGTPLFAANLSQEAVYAHLKGNLREAVAKQKAALRLKKRSLGRRHPAVAESLAHLGRAHLAAGHFRRARRYLGQAVAVHLRQGEHAERVRLANDRLAYGHAGLMLGLSSAEQELETALAEARKELGESHPVVTSALLELGVARRADGAAALALFEQAADAQSPRIGPVFAASSESRRLTFVEELVQGRNQALRLLVLGTLTGPHAVGVVLRLVAQRSGLTLDLRLRQRHALLSGRYPELTERVDRLRELDEQLAAVALGTAPTSSYRAAHEWERERDSLEAELALSIPELRADRALTEVTTQRLADALPAGSVLLQYVRFPHTADPRRPVHSHYGAFALPAGRPDLARFADLGPAARIDAQVETYRQAIAPKGGRGLTVTAGASEVDWRPLARELHQRLVAPLEIEPGQRLVVVADGSLHLIPLATLIGPDDEPLVRHTTITHLGSARDLLLSRESGPSGRPVVVAAPDYGPRQDNRRRAAVTGTFKPLTGSAEEGRQVAAVLGTTARTGGEARKDVLAADPAPEIIHLATHGIWAGERGAALAFAGANLPGDAGLLTAAEVAHLRLSGTRLVVLSACDTALGRIHDAEGVFGLFRAFTIAGARSVVATLWPIRDRATAEFMKLFYTTMSETSDHAAALAKVQAGFAAAGRPVHDWGGFLCHGGLRGATMSSHVPLAYDATSSAELNEIAARTAEVNLHPDEIRPIDIVVSGPCPACQGGTLHIEPIDLVRDTSAGGTQHVEVICRCAFPHESAPENTPGCGRSWTLTVTWDGR